jgi:hypothetical protein
MFSPLHARALNVLSEKFGHSVIALRDKLPEDSPDTHWLKVFGDEGDWIVFSGDISISRTPHLRKAWRESGLTAFFCQSGWTEKLKYWEQAALFVRRWPDVIHAASLVQAGAGFEVPLKAHLPFKQIV